MYFFKLKKERKTKKELIIITTFSKREKTKLRNVMSHVSRNTLAMITNSSLVDVEEKKKKKEKENKTFGIRRKGQKKKEKLEKRKEERERCRTHSH